MLNLITLHSAPEVRRISQFGAFARQLNVTDLCEGYAELVRIAPKRPNHGKLFFQGRTGVTASGAASNRREEHLATALFNASRAGKPFCLPDGQDLEIIDYQTPLKGKRENKGIGKIDLLGLINRTLPTIIELKIGKKGRGLADTPLRALLEGLAYCAIIEANIVAIAAEALYKLSVRMSVTRPALLIMAPEDYWTTYLERKSAGKWLPEINALADELRVALDMKIDLVSLSDATFEMGLEGTPARLTGLCKIRPVDELGDTK